MNEKAIQAMDSEEPETALEYLKKVSETIDKIEKTNGMPMNEEEFTS